MVSPIFCLVILVMKLNPLHATNDSIDVQTMTICSLTTNNTYWILIRKSTGSVASGNVSTISNVSLQCSSSTQECRIHSAVLELNAGIPKEGWSYNGIDCSDHLSPMEVDGNMTIFSCSSGYILITMTTSSCFKDGVWYKIHGACFEYVNWPSLSIEPVQPEEQFIIEMKTGIGEKNYMQFKTSSSDVTHLAKEMSWTSDGIRHYDVAWTDRVIIDSTLILEDTLLTLRFHSTASYDVGIFVNDTELTWNNTGMEPSVSDVLTFSNIAEIYRIMRI